MTDEGGFEWMVVYLDDVIIFAQTAKECWARAVRAMKYLSKWGFMLNVCKCKFVQTTAEVLGFHVANGYYAPGVKVLRKFASRSTPVDFD